MRHGFLLVNKPKGPTSHDIVGMARRTLGEKSIGHLGTLDPMAEGLMVLAVGSKALKVAELFSDLSKEYIATLEFGATSTTFDAEGVITKTDLPNGWQPPAEQARLNAIIADKFMGKIEQVPPQFSAIKVGGERAYRKAQQGQTVEMKARRVEIHSCIVLEYNYPKLVLKVSCSSGTYIRSLANDIGQALRCGAYLTKLVRTKVGDWSLDDAHTPDTVVWGHVIPLKEVLVGFPKLELTDDQWKEIGFGRSIEGALKPNLIAWHGELPVALLEASTKMPGMLKPRKVF